MISNQILQTTIEGLKGITRIDLCVCDTEGKVLATTFPDAEEYESSILIFVDSPADSQVIQGYQFFKVFDEHQLEYILLAKGGSDDAYMVGKLAAFQIQNLLVAYKERFDKDNFIKNLLLDKLRQGIDSLSGYEQQLLHQLFSQRLSERTIADMYGVSQVAIHKQKARTLAKLKKLLKI